MKGLAVYVSLAESTEQRLAEGLRQLAQSHAEEGEIHDTAVVLARWSHEHVAALAPARAKYGDEPSSEPDQLHLDAPAAARTGPVGLLRDLQELHLTASLADTTWTALLQASRGNRDEDLEQVALRCQDDITRVIAWLRTQLKQISPQALLIATS